MEKDKHMMGALPTHHCPVENAEPSNGWYALPLELRETILLEALESSIPHHCAKKALLCTLKKLIKISFSTGQVDLMQPLRVMVDTFEATQIMLATAMEDMRADARRIVVQEGIPVGYLWSRPKRWPFCDRSWCPVCGPHIQVTRLYYDLVAAFTEVLRCQAVLHEACWRLNQMQGHRECLNVIGRRDRIAQIRATFDHVASRQVPAVRRTSTKAWST